MRTLLLMALPLIACAPPRVAAPPFDMEGWVRHVGAVCGADEGCARAGIEMGIELMRADVDAAAVQPATQVIYQQAPVVQQRPYVVVPGVAPVVRTQIPGMYAVPSTERGGQTRFFTVQPLP